LKKLSIILILGIIACSKPQTNDSFDKLIKAKNYSVLMFIAPDCPLCMKLATSFSDLSDSFPEVQFLAVYSGKHYEPMEINMFATETKLKPHIFRDYEYEVAHQLGAGITPEFFLIDSNATILYQGMLDDRAEALGSYKQTWSNHYLQDAIKAVLSGTEVNPSKTEAVGCVLEY
jgi:thiol-disulfide isomerase/thioredoxin